MEELRSKTGGNSMSFIEDFQIKPESASTKKFRTIQYSPEFPMKLVQIPIENQTV
jgi:hypothetical protein